MAARSAAVRLPCHGRRGRPQLVLVRGAAEVNIGEAQTPPARQLKVKGKTVVITGGSQGCGRATALQFAGKGYNVVVAARAADRLESVAQEIMAKASNRSGAALAVQMDITDLESVQQLAKQVTDIYESVDVLVNNAGVCCSGPFADTTMEDWTDQLNVNFLGAVSVTRALLPQIEASKGAIVCVNSFGGVMPLYNMTAYTASKYALAGFADALRYEMKPKGVHVAQVHPGVINSDFMERAQFRGDDAEALRGRMSSMLSSGMGGVVQKPEEIAEAVLRAVDCKQDEIVVGPVFKAAVQAYRLTGVNPFGMPPPP